MLASRHIKREKGSLPVDVRPSKTSLLKLPNVFDEEVADIAQVHCNSELFEFELSTSPPCVNVKGNLRRNVEFWKHIVTPSFILNVIDRGYLLPLVSFSEPAVFTEKQQIVSSTCRVC